MRSCTYCPGYPKLFAHCSTWPAEAHDVPPRVHQSTSLASCPSYVQRPHHPIRIAPLGFGLDDERLAADRDLIAGTRACDLARPHLEGRRLGVDASLAEPDDRVR